jgi:hypothetical protein
MLRHWGVVSKDAAPFLFTGLNGYETETDFLKTANHSFFVSGTGLVGYTRRWRAATVRGDCGGAMSSAFE